MSQVRVRLPPLLLLFTNVNEENMAEKNNIDIYPVGTKVQLEEDILGTVLSITITGNHSSQVVYEIGWWSGKSFTKEHFYSYQFLKSSEKEKVRIGFS